MGLWELWAVGSKRRGVCVCVSLCPVSGPVSSLEQVLSWDLLDERE